MTSRSLFLLAASSLLAASVSFAQEPAAPPAGNPPAQHRPIPQPSNLKVLPKDTSGQQVITIMRKFSGDLGVECSYCHAKDPATNRLNFASDANPTKDRARVMMKMTTAINAEYLSQLTDPRPEHEVSCGTCHRGMPEPEVFVPKPEEHGPRPPQGAAPGTPPASH